MSSYPNESLLPDKAFRKAFASAFLADFPRAYITTVGRSILGDSIDLVSVGRGKRCVLYTAAHHGAERLGSNILYAFLLALAKAERDGGKIAGIDARFLLERTTFHVIPLVNPDGVYINSELKISNPLRERQIRMNGSLDFSRWSANARGVDLNHNYDSGFSEYKEIERREGIFAGRGRYSGEYPESEPESRAVANVLRTVSPSLVVSLHSQGEEIYYYPKCARTRAIANAAARLTGYLVAEASGSAAYGGLCDFSGELGIPSLTVEMGRGQNPLPVSEYYRNKMRLISMLTTLPTLL
ncbi:MAG: hypothetical protein IJY65_02410 [Clostridia bacterium]|nr:hypothetical protein [Clostridia bacterium]